MGKTAQEIIDEFAKVCEENGYKFLIQVDDGEHVTGKYFVRTGSRLHEMCRAVNDLSDTYTDTKIR